MGVRLKALTLRGFRSIRDLESFEPTPINIFIGANGAGKSNLVSFFRMLSFMTEERLQEHVAYLGGANAILHDGAQTTTQIETELCLETELGLNDYACRLFHAAGDTLIFAEERCRFSNQRFESPAKWIELGAGHRETKLGQAPAPAAKTAKTIRALLKRCVVYQFHNTSPSARVRQKWHKDENRWLKEDAANLAPFLLRLREERPEYYQRIVDATRSVLPFYDDYVLEADLSGSLILQWRERGTDMTFSAAQASDGMLRTMALIALLAQPEEDLPGVLILDEPELGLHPYAISVVAGLLRGASVHTQALVATQSTGLVDQFQPDEIVVVDRAGRDSTFKRLNAEPLKAWLAEYSISALWQRNVIGGRP